MVAARPAIPDGVYGPTFKLVGAAFGYHGHATGLSIVERHAREPQQCRFHAKVVEVLRGRVADGDEREHTRSVLDELDRRFAEAQAVPRMTFVDAEDLPTGRWPRVVECVKAAQVLDDWLHRDDSRTHSKARGLDARLDFS